MPRVNAKDDLWNRVVKQENGCWEWQGPRLRSGYGHMSYQGKTQKAHRLAWMFTKGEIPLGLFVCHTCDNPPCVNPSHLFLGDHVANVKDRHVKGRDASGDRNGARLHPEMLKRGDEHPSRFHPESIARGNRNGRFTKPERNARGEHNGSAKLTEDMVREIRSSYNPHKMGYHRLARIFSLNKSTIARVILRKTWTHVN